MDGSTKFWDRIAQRYARQPVADEAAYQRKLEVTRKYFDPSSRVLEIGCGTGSTAISHASFVKEILAIDFSSKMIEIARNKAEAASIENVVFEQTGADDLAVEDQSFDVVLGLSILHLLPGWEAVIAKVYRLLKPSGVFVTSTTCLGDTMSFFKYIAPLGKALGLMPELQIFTTEDLVASLTDTGFDIDNQWQPGKGKTVFIVAMKRG